MNNTYVCVFCCVTAAVVGCAPRATVEPMLICVDVTDFTGSVGDDGRRARFTVGQHAFGRGSQGLRALESFLSTVPPESSVVMCWRFSPVDLSDIAGGLAPDEALGMNVRFRELLRDRSIEIYEPSRYLWSWSEEEVLLRKKYRVVVGDMCH